MRPCHLPFTFRVSIQEQPAPGRYDPRNQNQTYRFNYRRTYYAFLDKPSVVVNANGREILVNQVGCYGVRLGRIDFYFDDERILAEGVSIVV